MRNAKKKNRIRKKKMNEEYLQVKDIAEDKVKIDKLIQ
ncbi:unnamed protein product [Paramecium sonneborni]|uniref:Uncharacterized protein n=1 Tax=Paramecium sonneborni TaxID=65129 RepID=A0A8S1MUS4_9CILI|nr:unnamed protein product [Paramecium sonneborni]